MRFTTTSAALILPLLLGGCNAALWGNVLVLGVTLGVFFGTLSLGREASRPGDDRASSSTSGS